MPWAGAAALTQPGQAVHADWCCITVARQWLNLTPLSAKQLRLQTEDMKCHLLSVTDLLGPGSDNTASAAAEGSQLRQLWQGRTSL